VQDTLLPPSEKHEVIKMYATKWCGDCRMARRWFDAHGIPYEFINIEEDESAAEYVVRVNGGMQSVPTLSFQMVLFWSNQDQGNLPRSSRRNL